MKLNAEVGEEAVERAEFNVFPSFNDPPGVVPEQAKELGVFSFAGFTLLGNSF